MATNNEIIFVSKGKVQKTIADNLTAIRDYLNLNNRNFAKLMDVTEPTISNYCNGVRMQPIDFLINVCKLNELKEDLCQIRLYISNLESELNILTL